ncbi:MAG TPA: hypothetical protein VKT29_05200, partial [Terriglobales bacterium]|nr:hypothetical protein [Terriglobales bacterium]
MPLVTVGILASESEQLDLLQTLVDATTAGRAILKESLTNLEFFIQKVRELKPQVLLVDIAPRNPSPSVAAIERLRAELPQISIFACGDMTKRHVIVEAMRAG